MHYILKAIKKNLKGAIGKVVPERSLDKSS